MIVDISEPSPYIPWAESSQHWDMKQQKEYMRWLKEETKERKNKK